MIKKEKRLKESIKEAMEYYGATFGKQDKECEYVTGNEERKRERRQVKERFQFESSCE
jgi:hypothetical protein